MSPHYSEDPPILEEEDPLVSYKYDAIDADQKQKLIDFVDSRADEFVTVGDSRETIYYGEYGYFYTGKYHPAKVIPIELQELLSCIRPQLTNPKAWMNSCLVTKYKDGNANIPLHSDNETFIDPSSEIITVSVGAERTVNFVNHSGDKNVDLDVSDCSAYVMTRSSQEHWRHGNIIKVSTLKHLLVGFFNIILLFCSKNIIY